MIAPEPAPGINTQTSRLALVRNNLLVTAVIFLLLECWRPCFFLTDDNFDGLYPLFTEMGRHLQSGRSPFYSDYLFGGNYYLLRDPACFAWHPLYLLSSLLAGTPGQVWMVEVDAFVLLLLATAGFVNLAHYLRREMRLTVSDGWIMFYAQSFTFTVIALTTGASWLNFLGNYSAMPWLTLGILLPSWRRGILLVALFSLHQLLGGHFSPTMSTSLLFTVFAAGMSVTRRSWVPLINWLGGYIAAVVFILPLFMPVVDGFLHSGRSHGVVLSDMQANNVPYGSFLPSVFVGMSLWYLNLHALPPVTYVLALGACAAAWCLLPAMVGRTRWRGLEVVSFGMMVLIAVLICRPEWVSEIMMRIPLVRSLRWPFREFLQFQFFLHLFILVRPPGLTPGVRWRTALLSSSLMVLPLVLFVVPPTFNPMHQDRALLFSGRFDRYWEKVRPLLKPGDRVAVLIPMTYYDDGKPNDGIPFSLLNSYNFAVFSRVINVWGYSPTAPGDQFYTQTIAVYPFGAYTPEQKAALMAERPELKFITLESLAPLKITLSSRDGPTVDLTPLIPPPGG